MANDATQNPANRWARNSGFGPGGISTIVPSAAEERRGLQQLSLDRPSAPGRTVALGLVAAVAAAVASAIVHRARQPQDLPTRILRRVGIR